MSLPGDAAPLGRTTALGDLAWPDVARRSVDSILAVPLGATEQHGPHLPLSTDTDIATALCTRLAGSRADVLVAPALPYGASGEHAGFPGTLSIGQDAFEHLVVELVRSVDGAFAHVLLVSGHGGNSEPLRRAEATLGAEGRDVLAWLPAWRGDAHAGRTETSMQLLLDGDRVRQERIAPGQTRSLRELMPAIRRGGIRAVSPSGVLGDPTGAGPVEGSEILDALGEQLADAVRRWRARRATT